MASSDQKRKAAAQTGLYLVIIAAILVMANIVSARGVYVRKDVTKNELFTLSKGSGRLIKSLNSPIQVDAYITRGLAQLDVFVRDLTDLLKEYERAGGGKFKFTLIEANTDELREQAKEAGLQPTAFGEGSATGAETASLATGYMGLVFKYGSEKEVIPLMRPDQNQGLEFWITNKIRYIRDKADEIEHKIGVVTNKDELKLTDGNLMPKQGQRGGPSIQQIISQAFPFYKIENVDLKDGAEEIDPEIVGLIVTQPRKAYTEKELRRIDQFLMLGGKSLAVFASAVTLKPNDATMNASLDLHGLDKLLSGYGINMKKNAVLDYGAQFRIGVMTQTGRMQYIRHPGIAHVVADPRFEDDKKLLDTGFATFFRMDELAIPFPSELELLPEKQPDADVKIYAVARTTPQATIDESTSIDMKLFREWKPKGEQAQRIVAAVAEGKLKASMGSKDDIKVNDQAKAPSRVLVVSSSQYLTNPFAYAGNGPDLGGQFQMFGAVGGDPDLLAVATPYAQKYLTPTILSFKNTLDWLSGDADLLAASAKLNTVANLSYRDVSPPKIDNPEDEEAIKKEEERYKNERKSIQAKVQWSLTLGLPCIFVAIGIGRWRLRESRRGKQRV